VEFCFGSPVPSPDLGVLTVVPSLAIYGTAPSNGSTVNGSTVPNPGMQVVFLVSKAALSLSHTHTHVHSLSHTYTHKHTCTHTHTHTHGYKF